MAFNVLNNVATPPAPFSPETSRLMGQDRSPEGPRSNPSVSNNIAASLAAAAEEASAADSELISAAAGKFLQLVYYTYLGGAFKIFCSTGSIAEQCCLCKHKAI